MSRLAGKIVISGLPPYRGIIINICFFKVAGAETPPPFNGDPPANAASDSEKIIEQVDLNIERTDAMFECHFNMQRPPGYYYMQLRAILFQSDQGRIFAQTEQFFFGRRPIQIAADIDGLTLPIAWPNLSIKELHTYETISPQEKPKK